MGYELEVGKGANFFSATEFKLFVLEDSIRLAKHAAFRFKSHGLSDSQVCPIILKNTENPENSPGFGGT